MRATLARGRSGSLSIMISRQYALHVELQRDAVPTFDAYPFDLPGIAVCHVNVSSDAKKLILTSRRESGSLNVPLVARASPGPSEVDAILR